MKLSKRFLFTLISFGVLGIGLAIAVFFAKGYRFSPTTGTITGTGIISVTSIPDQASVYLDGHLTTATNTNINNLSPKKYAVRITKEGYIPWEKEIEVKEGLVSEIKAILFRAIPTIYPVTFNGIEQVLTSPDNQKILYVVPQDPKAGTNPSSLAARKGGVWVWQISGGGLPLGRGDQQRQIASNLLSGLDFTQASAFRFSPDSNEVLVTFPDRYLLLETDRLNETPRDITPTVQALLKTWDDEERQRNSQKFNTIKDINLRREATGSATLKWAPDETKIVYSKDGKTNFKVFDLVEKKSFSLPDADYYDWLPDSDHLFLVEASKQQEAKLADKKTELELDVKEATGSVKQRMAASKISVIEYDGSNKAEIYAGLIDPYTIIAWPDGSRLVIVSSLPTATASTPNLYGVNLK